MRPPTIHHHQYNHHRFIDSSLASNSWSSNDIPQSWSQALVGGLAFDEEGYKQSSSIHMMQGNNIPLNQGLLLPTDHSISYASQPKSDLFTISSYKVEDDSAHISSNLKSPRRKSPYFSESKSNNKGGAAKKARVLVPHSQDLSTFKVRKEKLGDRITALHQLVSPFGKTDTASVLLESTGYIRFLHNQIEALSLPYLNSTKSKNTRQQQNNGCDEEEIKGLRSKGLCLVPIECTLDVGGDNNMGADYWASAFNAR